MVNGVCQQAVGNTSIPRHINRRRPISHSLDWDAADECFAQCVSGQSDITNSPGQPSIVGCAYGCYNSWGGGGAGSAGGRGWRRGGSINNTKHLCPGAGCKNSSDCGFGTCIKISGDSGCCYGGMHEWGQAAEWDNHGSRDWQQGGRINKRRRPSRFRRGHGAGNNTQDHGIIRCQDHNGTTWYGACTPQTTSGAFTCPKCNGKAEFIQ